MQIFKWGKVLAVSAALAVFEVPASAQDDEGGPQSQGDDAHYISATYIKFKPGKRESRHTGSARSIALPDR